MFTHAEYWIMSMKSEKPPDTGVGGVGGDAASVALGGTSTAPRRSRTDVNNGTETHNSHANAQSTPDISIAIDEFKRR